MDMITMNPALAGFEPVAADGKCVLEVADDVVPRPLTPVCPSRELSYLPERPPVDIEFTDLTYTVPQGRNGKSKRLSPISSAA